MLRGFKVDQSWEGEHKELDMQKETGIFPEMFEWNFGFEFLWAYSEILSLKEVENTAPTPIISETISRITLSKYLRRGCRKQEENTGRAFKGGNEPG